MSQVDFKSNLRKLDFPACAKEALTRIEIGRNKQIYSMKLISEFIFLEKPKDIDIRKTPQNFIASPMSSFQEFQLILVFIEFFSLPGPDSTRNAVFLSLFGTNLTPQRSKILSHLISTAISGSVSSVLISAGTWMQQVGCTTPPSLEVAKSLVTDFITFSRHTSDQLKQLPMVAPNFAANLMTSVADLYFNDQRGGIIPPDSLLDVFTEWIAENPSLCLASQQPLSLPSGAIATPVVTPLAGLLRWTVLAPLTSDRDMYSRLHLSLLQTLLHSNNTGPATALNAQHLAIIVLQLQSFCAHLATGNTLPSDNVAYQKCMERFAQAIQMSLKTNCVYGNIPQLLCALETLPPHPLMSLIIKSNKSL